ncbi:MAG: PEP-CTERM sorting domain-containing protein [Thermodesulfobacteriota bacterium]|nr:PEP-CTERM sorting domain-containing protein [Thermodesulfobacteriota bacterium]
MNISKKIIAAAVFMLVSIGFAGQVLCYTILPDPTLLYDGIPVASYHDDFWSYSAKIANALQDKGYLPESLGDFQFATGTGGLDVLLYTGAGGQTNQGVGPSGTFNFEDPVINKGGSATSFAGWWGQNDQDNDGTSENVNGPVTVGQVLDYLQACNPNNTVPVFYMDLNQTGTDPNLDFVGRVYLTDESGTIDHEWAFDNTQQLGDGNFDQDAWVLAPGVITVMGTSGTEYSVNNNKGSGKPDFIAYAPTMDLSLYNPNLRFVTEFDFQGLNNGYEEIFLSGAIGPPGTPIPEPATMLLLSSGMIGLAGLGRRKFRKKG